MNSLSFLKEGTKNTMLNSLSVQNYALISGLDVKFHPGLSAITGETGAGKSILMGALGLVLGNRADTTVLNDKSVKCVVEAGFSIEGINLEDFFKVNDLDFDKHTLIRREILPGGKSRAFVNDTPVTLPVLKNLGNQLVNIHAQHHNLLLKDEDFPLEVLDAFLGLEPLKHQFNELYKKFRDIQSNIKKLEKELSEAKKEQDYLEFQYTQLEEARLEGGEEDKLLDEQEILSHAEEIRMSLGSVINSFSDEENNVLQVIKRSLQEISSIQKYMSHLEEPSKRLDSVYIELKDLVSDLEQLLERVEANPERLSFLTDRLDLLYTLQKKHQVGSSKDLIKVQEEISSRLMNITSSDTELEKLVIDSKKVEAELNKLADQLSKTRKAGLSSLSQSVVDHLKELGMPHARFELEHSSLPEFSEYGLDKFAFLFSANKNQSLELIQKVASGGEMSRLMLSIKSLISESLAVPTLIFDEIDAGVSGEIADKMGKLLKKISLNRQVINVTHLPQVAGRGDFHFQVFKHDGERKTHTGIRLLDTNDRVVEMAKMLSGEQLTKEALSNAKALLHN